MNNAPPGGAALVTTSILGCLSQSNWELVSLSGKMWIMSLVPGITLWSGSSGNGWESGGLGEDVLLGIPTLENPQLDLFCYYS